MLIFARRMNNEYGLGDILDLNRFLHVQACVLTTYKVGCVSAETFMFKYFCFIHMLQIFKNGLDFGIFYINVFLTFHKKMRLVSQTFTFHYLSQKSILLPSHLAEKKKLNK